MISFSCSKCGKQYNLKPDFAGRKTTCSGCKEPLVVPSPEPTPSMEPEASSRIAFSCAKCGMKFNVMAEFAGRATKCPTCKEALVVPTPDAETVYSPSAGKLEGMSSSLVRARLNSGLTLDGAAAGISTLQDLLDSQAGDGARYVIDKELARGGMGAVLRAIDCDIRREVAIKYLLDQTNAKNKIRFVEEAQITGQLEHPNIVPVHEIGLDGHKRLFFAMKMVKGRSLAQILSAVRQDSANAEGEYSLSRLLNILVDVCNALAYAHSRGVVHRDLKPANIMVGDFGEVYVMDWGLAKVLDKGSAGVEMGPPMAMAIPTATLAMPGESAPIPEATLAEPSRTEGMAFSAGSGKVVTSRDADADLTQAGAVMGTPVYMPPEQAAGRIDEIDARSDIYSMGAILYEVLTLEPPIDRTGGFWPIVMRVGQGQIDLPEKKAPDRFLAGKIPPELAAVAMKALAKEKANRYATVEAFRADLDLFLEGRSVSAKVDTVREMAVKLVKRNKGVSIATAAASLILAIVGIWSLIAVLSANSRTLAEQKEKEKRTREAVPAFIKAARQAILHSEFDDAFTQTKVALDYDSQNSDALLLKGQLLISRKEFSAAGKELAAYIKLRPKDALAQDLAKLCEGEASDPNVQEAIAHVLIAQKQLALAVGLLRDNEKRLAMYRKQIGAEWPEQADLLHFDTEHRLTFALDGSRASKEILDLTPLKGIPISNLQLQGLKISDLRPLRGMPLTRLVLIHLWNLREIPDLGPVPLNSLLIVNCQRLEDVRGLKGLPISSIEYSSGGHYPLGRLKDLTPLRGLPLQFLSLHGGEFVDIEPLRGMKLRTLHLMYTRNFEDISPLRGMPLVELNLRVTTVNDLSSLQGMPLEKLNIEFTAVNDLSPLKDMPLKSLNARGCLTLSQIDALKGMRLHVLELRGTKIRDVTLLEGQPLVHLDVSETAVSDLSPLKKMPLKKLYFSGCGVEDIRPLTEMNDLAEIGMFGTKVRDLTPLRGMKLKYIDLPTPVQSLKGLEILREMKSLQVIHNGGGTIPNFWQKLDKGEIK